ncbi:MAG: alpha/beta fold hydrolase [Candidatus Bathyarchaeia archaeon]
MASWDPNWQTWAAGCTVSIEEAWETRRSLICQEGDTKSFERHLEDIDEVVDFVCKAQSGKKVYLFGHSIGCAYALWYAAKNPEKTDGLILAAPPVKEGFKLPFGDTLRLILSPAFSHHSMYNLVDEWPQAFKETEEYKLITGDELSTKEFGLGFLFDVQTKVVNAMSHNASKVKKPVFLVHGNQDVIALPESSKIMLDKLGSEDKTLQMFPGADHFFYQSIIPRMGLKYDLDRKKTVSNAVNDWLKKH